MIMMK